MNPVCESCGGACCKYFIIPYKMLFSDNKKWAENHTGVVVTKTSIEVEIPCKFLVDGKCTCYETRPGCCRNHQVGGDMCRDAIKKMHAEKKQKELLRLISDTNMTEIHVDSTNDD